MLIHRLVQHAPRVEPLVVTLAASRGAEFDAGQPFAVRRVRLPQQAPRAASMGLLNARAVAAAVRFRPDVVLSGHIVTSPAAALIRRALGVPVVQYLYAKEIGARPRLTRYAVRHADAVVAISRYTRDLALGVGAPIGRLHLIAPGVDLPADPGPVPRDEPSSSFAPTLITVARLQDRYKGHDVVLRAMALIVERVPDARYVIVGDGPLRPSLERLAVELGVGHRVHFAGAVSDEEHDAWLRSAQLFVMPSRLPASGAGEGFGIVYLEAAARGLPVIAGAVAGALDAVRDGETGLLVDPTDHVAVADAACELLLDPGRAGQLGSQGCAHAQRFAWPLVAARVQDLLEQTAAAGVQRG